MNDTQEFQMVSKNAGTPLLNEHSEFTSIVSAGGGVKAWAFLGVRAALDAFKFPFDKVKRAGGTSAGSINALGMFDQGRYVSDSGVAPNQAIENPDTIGFYFAPGSKKYLLEDRSTGEPTVPDSKPIQSAIDYFFSLISLYSDNGQLNEHIREHGNKRTIYIDSGEVSAIDFDLTNEVKKKLIMAGWVSVCEAYGRNMPVPNALLDLPENEHEVEESWLESCTVS